MYGLLTGERARDSVPAYQPCDFVYKIANSGAELSSFWRLRRQIFCEEQRVFQGSDRDQYDAGMIPIICSTLLAGMEDQVVGAARIDERAPGNWWGSRLGVRRGYRTLRAISPGVSIRNRQPGFYAERSIGAGLIYKAVSTAPRLGCETFHAHVQRQNVVFFRRRHWHVLEEVELYGIKHAKMATDLYYYPPAEQTLDTVLVA